MKRQLVNILLAASTALAVLAVSAGAGVKSQTTVAPIDAAFLSGDEAHIRNGVGQSEVEFLIVQPERYSDGAGQLLVSVEVPRRAKITRSTATSAFWSTKFDGATYNDSAAVEFKPFEIVGINMPPGPNDDTKWLTFARNVKDLGAYTQGPLVVRIPIATDTVLNFARVLIGHPSTPRSVIIGAFAPATVSRQQLVSPGVDYLGTVTARQHFRIPANALAPNTDAFDEMVDFGDAPFEPDKNNIDTVMLRARAIHAGETTPVRLLRFANRSKNPIRIHSKSGDLLYVITARLSPNARSGGFITILPDGTYRSTTTLTPILEFQRVEDGKPVDIPIVIDTAITPVVGFPFYLASSGGRWVSRAPVGRLTNAMTSGFFYNNGAQNAFIHSNGPSLGIVGKCAKASAQFRSGIVGENF